MVTTEDGFNEKWSNFCLSRNIAENEWILGPTFVVKRLHSINYDSCNLHRCLLIVISTNVGKGINWNLLSPIDSKLFVEQTYYVHWYLHYSITFSAIKYTALNFQLFHHFCLFNMTNPLLSVNCTCLKESH